MKTSNDITLKTGVFIPANTEIAIKFLGESNPRLAELTPIDGVMFRLKVTNLHRYFRGFKVPSESALERWNNDGVCLTPTGKRVEPDGYGNDDSPSWLLAMGYI